MLAEVRKKLGGVTSEAVRQRRARIQKAVPMANDIALYVLAHQLGLPVQRWVRDADTLQQVAGYAQQVAGTTEAPAVRASSTRKQSRAVTRPAELRLDNITVPAGLLNLKHLREAERMSNRVYPLLYVFENSAREYIDGHLSSVYGKDWWDDPKIVSTPVRRNVEIARKAEAENRYHTARNARPVYYMSLGDLALIVGSENGWRVFKPPRLPRQTWFTELIQSAEVSRNIVAHMNPLQPADIKALEMSVQNWLKQIAGDSPPSIT
ncbi:MAG: hypothetical protein QOE36_170 [Gaiellaceae bacterium]|jgi:hypothetical protein|nr:hypothetical protein [Gaiellaceae bacterium]